MGGKGILAVFVISILSPHTRGDADETGGFWSGLAFQSTPLIRGETRATMVHHIVPLISIHSPHARGDPVLATPLDAYSIFQSAPLSRGETKSIIGRDDAEHISIRSPHARGDLCRLRKWGIKIYFNPLPSHEGRQHKPPKIHPDLRQLTQQNHDTPLFGALQAPFCGAEPDIRGAKPMGKP